MSEVAVPPTDRRTTGWRCLQRRFARRTRLPHPAFVPPCHRCLREPDLDRVLEGIYGKEARKRDAAAESGAQSDVAGIATPLFFDPWAELQPPTFPIDALPPVLRAFAEDRA